MQLRLKICATVQIAARGLLAAVLMLGVLMTAKASATADGVPLMPFPIRGDHYRIICKPKPEMEYIILKEYPAHRYTWIGKASNYWVYMTDADFDLNFYRSDEYLHYDQQPGDPPMDIFQTFGGYLFDGENRRVIKDGHGEQNEFFFPADEWNCSVEKVFPDNYRAVGVDAVIDITDVFDEVLLSFGVREEKGEKGKYIHVYGVPYAMPTDENIKQHIYMASNESERNTEYKNWLKKKILLTYKNGEIVENFYFRSECSTGHKISNYTFFDTLQGTKTHAKSRKRGQAMGINSTYGGVYFVPRKIFTVYGVQFMQGNLTRIRSSYYALVDDLKSELHSMSACGIGVRDDVGGRQMIREKKYWLPVVRWVNKHVNPQ